MKAKKQRLDIELTERGHTTSREKAKAFIMAGEVFVNDQVEIKPDRQVSSADKIEVKVKNQYVSRGAFKLEKAIKDFNFDLRRKKVLDIGISNGGFADYMLKNGIDRITGVDVNINQVDYSLRKNDKVTLLKMNARFLKPQHIGFKPELITIDVSFISVTKIFEALVDFEDVEIISLIKPQFEAEKGRVGKGGVIKSVEKRVEIVLRIKKELEKMNYSIINFTKAGIAGKKGNQEFFFHLKYGINDSIDDKIIINGI
ncbi:MAG: TlyA family RNA methyltransferase [Acidobacteriota bacterium]